MFDFKSMARDALDVVRGGTRVEAQGAARRLVGTWDFYRDCLRVLPEAELAIVDTYDAIAAEIGASVNRSSQYGHALLDYAITMHERLPKTGAVFLAGDIDYFTFRTIAYRTGQITDPDILAAVDDRIAAKAASWTATPKKLATKVDDIVISHDPAAVRSKAESDLDNCAIDISENAAGFAEIHGTVLRSTGAALDARLDALAHTVCSGDPRTFERRRADAMDTLVAGLDRMVCRCGRADCPARKKNKKASPTNVYLVGEKAPTANTDTEPDPEPTSDPVEPDPAPEPVGADDAEDVEADGRDDAEPETDDDPPAEKVSPADEAGPAERPNADVASPAKVRPPEPSANPPDETRWRPGYLIGSDELIPPEVMAEIMATANQIPIHHPGPHSAPEPGYHPSKQLCDFIKARDLTCRAPGCDKPATHCQIDHTVPKSQGGQTHPSNLKLLCNEHHVLKTFWGWQDEQLPDGTVIWTTTAGQTATTYPGSRDLFPSLCEPTGALDQPKYQSRCDPNNPKMPKLRKTRQQERAERIHRERAKNPPPF